MTKFFTTLLLTSAVAFFSSAQDDVSEIFADLPDFEPTGISESPTIEMPDSTPDSSATPLTIQMPAQDNPVLFTAANETPSTTQSVASLLPETDTTWSLADMLTKGKEAYGDNLWNEAQQWFEAALHHDPHNKDAIKWLERIARKKSNIETRNYNTTRSRMLADVQAAWNSPKPTGDLTDFETSKRAPTKEEELANTLKTKLEDIRIPAVDFQNADIQQVVLKLTALFRQLDSEGTGVNLVTFGTSETLLSPITFSGTNLSALEMLDIITQIAGMKYDVGPNRVSLTPINYEPPQQMVSAELDILTAVGAKMTMMTREEPGTSGLLDVRGFFSTIPFPTGSSAQYNPEFNLLLVHNSPQHIEKVKALLDRYNQKALEESARQVEIETKFIEVAEGALEELGFKWTVGTAGELMTKGDVAMPGGQNIFTDTLRTSQTAIQHPISTADRATSFNSYAGSVTQPLGDGLAGTAGEMLIQKISGTPVDVLIRALERQAGSDLLSAPKVLAKSGETATIHVGEVRWFPTAYDVIIERYAQPSLLPLDYEEYKTGVLLSVTPALNIENGTIDLDLAPEIRELAGYDEQHVSTLWPDYEDEDLTFYRDIPDVAEDYSEALVDFLTAREENRTINADRLIARQPVFRSRKVETSVTIEDGSTIAMGGLIKEATETFKDSVPILGKIPLLGRFFRSEGEQTVKRNLIIFVTANQVDSTGYKTAAR